MTKDNDMIIARIKGVKAQAGNAETDADPRNPNVMRSTKDVRIAELEAALLKIAFDEDVSELAGNPMRWSSTIAYLALGGKIEDGQRITTEAELRNS